MDQWLVDSPAAAVDDGDGEELLYENIEAPKFVDLTAPDLYKSGDDRYWFCTRYGCDLKHEEEIDPEAIYRSFVLRVMASRSPNVRLKNALQRKNSSANLKCPKSVPPKSSKPKLAKLALVSSISKQLNVSKGITCSSSTKFATPSNKKQISKKKESSPKRVQEAAKRSGAAAKALLFSSNKKNPPLKARHPRNVKNSDNSEKHETPKSGNAVAVGNSRAKTDREDAVVEKIKLLANNGGDQKKRQGENDDKENTAALEDDTRNTNQRMESAKKKPSKPTDKNTSDMHRSEFLKQGKLQTTKLKPFRLRTDERRILKENNTERKITEEKPEEEKKSAKNQRKPQKFEASRFATSHSHKNREDEEQKARGDPLRHTVSSRQKLVYAKSEKENSKTQLLNLKTEQRRDPKVQKCNSLIDSKAVVPKKSTVLGTK